LTGGLVSAGLVSRGFGTNSADRLFALRSGIVGDLSPGLITGIGSRGGMMRRPGVSKLFRRPGGVVVGGSTGLISLSGGSGWSSGIGGGAVLTS
jgi:hypothetical protein